MLSKKPNYVYSYDGFFAAQNTATFLTVLEMLVVSLNCTTWHFTMQSASRGFLREIGENNYL